MWWEYEKLVQRSFVFLLFISQQIVLGVDVEERPSILVDTRHEPAAAPFTSAPQLLAGRGGSRITRLIGAGHEMTSSF